MTLAAEKGPAQGRIFDLVERGFLVALSLTAVVRVAPAVSAEPRNALILASEFLGVAFILLRRPALNSDQSPYATAVAFLGTAAPLLVIAPGGGLIPMALGFWIMVAGLLLNISAKLALNRSFGLAAANRGVKRAGPYRLVRHPMYAGYAATQVTFLLLNPCLWNMSVYLLAWSVQILRIQAEEKVLLEDPAYRAYADAVPHRLVPGFY